MFGIYCNRRGAVWGALPPTGHFKVIHLALPSLRLNVRLCTYYITHLHTNIKLLKLLSF